MNILNAKGLGFKVTVKTVKKHKFVEGRPEESHKGVYNLTLSGGGKSHEAKNIVGTHDLFAKAYAMAAIYFPKGYAKFQAQAKVERDANKAAAKASRKAKKAAAAPADLKGLLTLLNRQKKGNGKVLALFL